MAKNGTRPINLNTFTIVIRLIEAILGIAVCCAAGIYCHEDECSPTWIRRYKMYGQAYVLLAGAAGVTVSLLFLLCRCTYLCRNHWRNTEVALINLAFAMFLVAATVETFYASGYGRRFFKLQWRAAAAFSWMTSLAYAVDLGHLWCFQARTSS